jgi:hypothetical protein
MKNEVMNRIFIVITNNYYAKKDIYNMCHFLWEINLSFDKPGLS